MKLKQGDIVIDLERWEKSFLTHLEALSYSKNTLIAYSRIIEQFYEYSLLFQGEMTIDEINLPYIANFILFLERNSKNGKNLSKRTKNDYLKIISVFLNYISDNNSDLYSFNINFKKLKPKGEKAAEKLDYLTDSEAERFIAVLERNIDKRGSYNSYRDSLLFKLMLCAGLRASEALAIKLADISTNSPEMLKIRVWGKGGKEQNAYIKKDKICRELEYMRTCVKDDEIIFKTKSNRQLSRIEAFLIAKNLYKQALIQKQGLHILRHTLAMQLVAKNINLSVIQKILRHSNISETIIYAKASPETIEAALMAN